MRCGESARSPRKRLRERGIERLVDVRAATPGVLQEAVGSHAEWLRRLADGIDDRPVEPNQSAKSSGTRKHVRRRTSPISREIRREVDEMARDGAAWLERKTLFCRTVTIKVRYNDFTTITRSHSSGAPTRDADDIAARAIALLEQNRGRSAPGPVARRQRPQSRGSELRRTTVRGCRCSMTSLMSRRRASRGGGSEPTKRLARERVGQSQQ